MGNLDIENAAVHVEEAIFAMAQHPGTLQERLYSVAHDLSMLVEGGPHRLGPPGKQPRAVEVATSELDAIWRELHAAPQPEVGRKYGNALESSIMSMTDEQASEVVRRLCVVSGLLSAPHQRLL